MPGGTLELTSNTDFPAVTALVGTELIPAITPDGRPVKLTASQLQNPATNAGLIFAAWVTLAAVPGSTRGQRAEVINDGGTHTDPVTGATQPNNGVYSWSPAPVGWQYLGAAVSGGAAQIAAETQARKDGDTALSASAAQEIKDRSAADAALGQQITTEAQARKDADTALSTSISQEVKDRSDANAGLSRQIADEAAARGRGDASEAEARRQAVATEAQARRDGDDAGTTLLEAVTLGPRDKPGASPFFFTQALGGAPGAADPLDPAGCVVDAYGLAWRASGTQFVTLRGAVPYDAASTFFAQGRYVRVATPSDPNNDLVRFGIQWLDANYSEIGRSGVADIQDATPASGLVTCGVHVPSQPGDASYDAAPAGTVYWRPFIQTYGKDGVTDITALKAQDVSSVAVVATNLFPADRPGDTPSAFTPQLASVIDPAQYPPLPASGAVVGEQGAAYRMVGVQSCVSREMFAVEPDRSYQARVAFTRSQNASAGGDDRVRFGIRCYDAFKALIADVPLYDFRAVTVKSGRQGITQNLARVPYGAGNLVAYCCYVRLYITTYDTLQGVDVEVVRWTDVSDYTLYTPDTSALKDALAAETTARMRGDADNNYFGGSKPINDQDYAGVAADLGVSMMALSAPRTVTLPALGSMSLFRPFVVADESGQCVPTTPITVVPAAGDTINGRSDPIVLASPFQIVAPKAGRQTWLLGAVVSDYTQFNSGTPIGQNAAFNSKTINDQDYAAVAADQGVSVMTLTAARTITLPVLAAMQRSKPFFIADESGNCSPTNTITVVPNGSDKINGSSDPIVIATKFGSLSPKAGASTWLLD